jgi:pimeloyl-ACP methyl ester carboxylesterase
MMQSLAEPRALLALAATVVLCAACAAPGLSGKPPALAIQEQGSFSVGGTVKKAPGTFDPIAQGAYTPTPNPQGQTLHGDLRQRFSVYLLDQPRRGRAAKSTAPTEIPATPDEQMWFGVFRLGVWPEFHPGVAFSKDGSALEQFFRQSVPNTGPYDVEVNTNAVSALFSRIGPGVLVTHSQSGTLGWRTAIKNPNVRAIVSFEPGGDFVFPEGEAPTLSFGGRPFTPPTIPQADFRRLTKIPIVIYYGDNIPEQASSNPGQEQWRVFRNVARLWRDTVNRHGGDVTLVELPAIGIRGNTHFPMSDLNNVDVAKNMAGWLQQKRLDR